MAGAKRIHTIQTHPIQARHSNKISKNPYTLKHVFQVRLLFIPRHSAICKLQTGMISLENSFHLKVENSSVSCTDL